MDCLNKKVICTTGLETQIAPKIKCTPWFWNILNLFFQVNVYGESLDFEEDLTTVYLEFSNYLPYEYMLVIK